MKLRLCLIVLMLLFNFVSAYEDILTNWANKIGARLWELGCNLTNNLKLKIDYSHVNVVELDGDTIIKEMANHIKNMLDLKKYALRRIVHVAEESSKNSTDEVTEDIRRNFNFKNAKNLTEKIGENEATNITLKPNINFFNAPVTTNFSTVHVPTDVYEKGNETLLGIKWSEELDLTFKHNYEFDSSLSWQYFASATGFMRIYPGYDWKADKNKESAIEKLDDLFDARSRPWYIEAATDPKDIVILVDNSGSMMGQKRKIARHTINTILETLGPNDFVNIFGFTNTTEPVVKCFNYSLVQANLDTIRQLKLGVERMSDATNLANFETALTKAFEVLLHHRDEHLASMCNQAIMLITDGVPDNYQHIFEKYNWKNSTESLFPVIPVRVFTYLIGRDGANFRETKWMACANQGYYVQLNTIPEVKEQVFNYINVLARPLVLQNVQKIAWSSLYAHKIDPKITDRYWEEEQDKQQTQNTISFTKNYSLFLTADEQLKRYKERKLIEMDQNKNFGYDNFHFMITVSHPAYDRRNKKNITENILINEAYWTQRVYEADVATLLGVAGTDIPISEFKKIMKPHYLGVNNYGFIVNNNGYIIVHPDLRPVFRGTLKPGYNSVDLLEVELLDDSNPNREPRDFGIDVQIKNGEPTYILKNLSLLRDYVINQSDYTRSYPVKYHYDNMRRASTGERKYFLRKIENSPFTIVLAFMKQNCKNGNCQPLARIVIPEEKITMNELIINTLFSEKWTIHPDWLYCKYHYKNEYYDEWAEGRITNKTTELIHFLKKMIYDQKLQASRNPYADSSDGSNSNTGRKSTSYHWNKDKSTKKEGNFAILSYFCDKELLRNVIYDANVTKNIFQHLKNGINVSPKLNSKITNVFVATHSGLTRWKDLTINASNFGFKNNRSIEEVWYRRAVEQHYINDDSFVFSTPTESEPLEDSLVTASHAIFIKEKRKNANLEAPVAVTGFQIKYSDLREYIQGVINNLPHDGFSSMNYFILDNNGYVLISNDTNDKGKFFGALYPTLMTSYKNCGIFREIIIYDYQGVCFHDPYKMTNAAIRISINPLYQIQKFMISMIGITLNIIKLNMQIISSSLTSIYCESPEVDFNDISSYETFHDILIDKEPLKYSRVKHVVMINRTRPQTCDRRAILYRLETENKWDHSNSNCSDALKNVRIIPHTNLLLVLVPNIADNKKDVEQIKPLSTEPAFVKTSVFIKDDFDSPVCYKVNAVLSRRRPFTCCSKHNQEKKITLCGLGSTVTANSLFAVTLSISITWLSRIGLV